MSVATAKAKSPKKSVRRPLKGVAANPELRGRGPEKGAPNAGRPKGSFYDFLRKVRESEGLQKAIERAAKDEECKSFGHVLKLVRDYDPDAPERKVSVDATVAATLTLRVEYAQPKRDTTQSIGSASWDLVK